MMLGARVMGVVFVKMSGFSIFSSFWINIAVVGRISRVVVVVGGAIKLEEVMEGPGREMTGF